MLWIALLAGCGMGSFTTEDGPEPLRAALFFTPDSTVTLATQDSRQVYLLLANSTIPCEPADVEDDPATTTDETVAAREYWEAQFATAFAREGALVVAMVLSVGAEEDWLGRYPLQSDAWDLTEMATYVEEDGRVAAGGWYSVEEASVEDANGVLYASAIEIDEEEHDLAVGAPAWVEITAKDAVLAGTFDFAPVELGGSFEAARCENSTLLTDLYQQLGAMVIAEQAGDDDTVILE